MTFKNKDYIMSWKSIQLASVFQMSIKCAEQEMNILREQFKHHHRDQTNAYNDQHAKIF